MRLRRIFLEALVVATAGCGGRVAESELANADTGSRVTVTAHDSATPFDAPISVDADEPEAVAIEEDTWVPAEDTSPAWDAPTDTHYGPFDSAGFDASVCDGGAMWVALGSTTGAYGCGSSFTSTELWPCGLPASGFVSAYGTAPANAICADVCARNNAGDAGDAGYSSCYYGSGSCIFDDVARTVACTKTCSCGGGRRPAQYRDRAHRGPALASFFATMADLEAVSVDAFAILRSELAAHGAPKSLLRRCSKSARDEVRHARTMRRLARRFGAARREAPIVSRGPTRSVEEIARENSIEGCVRETWGAALAVIQARNARDPSIRDAMRKIAADETRHAELSWEISKFLDRKLDRAARARLRSRRMTAVSELRDEVAAGFHAPLVEHAGLPARDEALAMFDALASRIWS